MRSLAATRTYVFGGASNSACPGFLESFLSAQRVRRIACSRRLGAEFRWRRRSTCPVSPQLPPGEVGLEWRLRRATRSRRPAPSRAADNVLPAVIPGLVNKPLPLRLRDLCGQKGRARRPERTPARRAGHCCGWDRRTSGCHTWLRRTRRRCDHRQPCRHRHGAGQAHGAVCRQSPQCRG